MKPSYKSNQSAMANAVNGLSPEICHVGKADSVYELEGSMSRLNWIESDRFPGVRDSAMVTKVEGRNLGEPERSSSRRRL